MPNFRCHWIYPRFPGARKQQSLGTPECGFVLYLDSASTTSLVPGTEESGCQGVFDSTCYNASIGSTHLEVAHSLTNFTAYHRFITQAPPAYSLSGLRTALEIKRTQVRWMREKTLYAMGKIAEQSSLTVKF
jgi:hypothetical protein